MSLFSKFLKGCKKQDFDGTHGFNKNYNDAVGDILTDIEHIVGSDSNDWLTGDGENNTLYGSDGDDRLEGGEGNDILEGNEGRDYLDGGAGVDILEGNENSRG